MQHNELTHTIQELELYKSLYPSRYSPPHPISLAQGWFLHIHLEVSSIIIIQLGNIFPIISNDSSAASLICYGCHNKIPRVGGTSSFWRLEVQDQGFARLGFLWGLSPWLVDGPPSCRVFIWVSLCMHTPLVPLCVSKFLSLKGTSQIRLGPNWKSYFNLLTPLTALALNEVTFQGTESKGFSMNFSGGGMT